MDGQRQRKALSAAEQAVRALSAGDADKARQAAASAAELDQVGSFSAFAPLVEAAADDLTSGGVPAERWAAIADALGVGPLSALAEEQARLARG
jgi:hypothetical protein